MKTYFAALVLAVLAVQSAQADWVIVQKTTTDGKEEMITLKVKGDKARTDVGTKMSMIMDSTDGKVALVMHEQKVIMKMDPDTMKSALAMAGNLLGGKDKTPAKPVATGQKEKVGPYDTEIYTWTGAVGSGKFWIAKDVPHAQELNALQDKLMKAMGSPLASLAPASTDFPGMPVKSEMTMLGKTVLSETVSVREEPVDDLIFALPADYKEMKMPGGK